MRPREHRRRVKADARRLRVRALDGLLKRELENSSQFYSRGFDFRVPTAGWMRLVVVAAIFVLI